MTDRNLRGDRHMAARRSGTRHLMLAGPQARVLQIAFRSVRTGPAAYAHGTVHAAADAGQSADSVTDPLCGMTVDPAGTAAHAGYAGQAYYFCSDGCARQFAADPLAVPTEATDPVCGTPVRVPDALFAAQRDGVRYVFCGSGCRDHSAVGRKSHAAHRQRAMAGTSAELSEYPLPGVHRGGAESWPA
jgi:YHS domain-containing protein